MKYDVVIVGGGTAGLIAGIASARLGVNTLLVEQKGYVGGLAAIGMTLGGFKDRFNHQIINGIPQELADRVLIKGGGLGHISTTAKDRWITSLLSLDPETLKYVGQEMLLEAGCKFLLLTTFINVIREGNIIKGIEVFNHSGQKKILGKIFIDATGDGALAVKTGAQFNKGDNKGKHQAATSIFRVSNVNITKFEKFMNETLNTHSRDKWEINNAPTRSGWIYWTPWRVSARDDLPKTCGIYYHGNRGDIFINSTHVEVKDIFDFYEISIAAIELRRQAFRIFNYLENNVSGFEKAYISYIYDIGIRDSRRIIGDYILTKNDILNQVSFPDTIAVGAYPPDVHRSYGEVNIDVKENLGYEIPYRCLIPKGIENILVVGKCISTTFIAQAAVRGMGPCMSTGQCGGVAAALACQKKVSLRDLDISILKREIKKWNKLIKER